MRAEIERALQEVDGAVQPGRAGEAVHRPAGEEWLPDSEELTPTMKLKRRGVHTKYAVEIDALYRVDRRRSAAPCWRRRRGSPTASPSSWGRCWPTAGSTAAPRSASGSSLPPLLLTGLQLARRRALVPDRREFPLIVVLGRRPVQRPGDLVLLRTRPDGRGRGQPHRLLLPGDGGVGRDRHRRDPAVGPSGPRRRPRHRGGDRSGRAPAATRTSRPWACSAPWGRRWGSPSTSS